MTTIRRRSPAEIQPATGGLRTTDRSGSQSGLLFLEHEPNVVVLESTYQKWTAERRAGGSTRSLKRRPACSSPRLDRDVIQERVGDVTTGGLLRPSSFPATRVRGPVCFRRVKGAWIVETYAGRAHIGAPFAPGPVCFTPPRCHPQAELVGASVIPAASRAAIRYRAHRGKSNDLTSCSRNQTIDRVWN